MKLDWKYFMNSIDEAIEMLAINRKGAIDNGVAKEVVDEYIYNQAQKMFDKLESYDDLQTENGHTPEASWEMGGALLGEYTMHSFGEFPKEENESHLSQILEEEAHPKYSLSAKACKGILSRASRRGKELPEILRDALERQAEE